MKKSLQVQTIFSAVDAAIPILLQDYANLSKIQITQKGLKDFVSETDIKVERILVENLKKSFPEYGFLVEENQIFNTDSKDYQYRWIIDAIDGTFNFLHQLPNFCISIALEHKMENRSEIIAAVVAVPVTSEFFWAERGMGAYRMYQGCEQRMQVSNRKNFEDLLAIVNFIENANTPQKRTMLRSLIDNNTQIRVLGSAVLEMAYLACGKCDILMLDGLKPWDIAAGMLLMIESGSASSDFGQAPLSINHQNVVAAHPELFALLKSYDFFNLEENLNEQDNLNKSILVGG